MKNKILIFMTMAVMVLAGCDHSIKEAVSDADTEDTEEVVSSIDAEDVVSDVDTEVSLSAARVIWKETKDGKVTTYLLGSTKKEDLLQAGTKLYGEDDNITGFIDRFGFVYKGRISTRGGVDFFDGEYLGLCYGGDFARFGAYRNTLMTDCTVETEYKEGLGYAALSFPLNQTISHGKNHGITNIELVQAECFENIERYDIVNPEGFDPRLGYFDPIISKVNSDDLVLKVKIDSCHNIYMSGDGFFDILIDWGDGKEEPIFTENGFLVVKKYEHCGSVQVVVSGDGNFSKIRFDKTIDHADHAGLGSKYLLDPEDKYTHVSTNKARFKIINTPQQ